MKLKILILLLFYTLIYSLTYTLNAQPKGKIVKNQSVKATSIWIDTLSFKMWLVEVKNTNNCVSDIVIVNVSGEKDTTVFEVEPNGTVKVLADDYFVISFRNGTSCSGGSMDWLEIDYKELGNVLTLVSQSPMKDESVIYPILTPIHHPIKMY